jgi:hypothetical protein
MGNDLAEEFVSAVGWGLAHGDDRAREALGMDPKAIHDPAVQAVYVALQVQADAGEVTWGLVRQRMLEAGMNPVGYQNSVIVNRLATENGYVGFWHIPGLRTKLEELRERREAWEQAAEVIRTEGASKW